jgi:hypothetical protein
MIEEMPHRGGFPTQAPLLISIRRAGMKSVSFFISLIAVIFASSLASAQAPVVQPPGSRSSDQWVSHQMNQPPPGAGDKYSVSPDRLDEIQQLYLQAKKELDAKADTKVKDKK